MGSIETLLRRFDRAHRQVPIAIASLLLLGALLLGVSILASRAHDESVRQRNLHDHTLEVLLTADAVEIELLTIIRAERSFLLTQREHELQTHERGMRAVMSSLDKLDQLTLDNAVQQSRLVRLRREMVSYFYVTKQILDLRKAGDIDGAMAALRNGAKQDVMGQISASINDIKTTEQELLALRSQRAEMSSRRQLVVLYAVALAGVFVLIFASLAVVALRQAFARERTYRRELRRLADTDELTGLANRRELMAGLGRAISGSRRSDEPLAFALVDIDHFKRVNDTYGHPAGDEVIRKIARAAMAAVRGCDLVGRLGGEEFAIVLPGAGVAAAYTVCERLRDRIQQEEIDLPDGQIVSVTISSGVAWLNDDDTALTLLERADQALYRAKSDGRDLVRLAA